MKEKEKYSYEEAEEYARKILEEMAAAGVTYGDAARILRMAQNKLGEKMRKETVKASQ